jgi:hypothetical protein
MKIYCDETNRNSAKQFVTEHLLIHEVSFFCKCSIWLPLVMR